jgi:RNA polymerase sigma-70 factor (ECF subfamily)
VWVDDERALVARMRDGDGEALRRLVTVYHRPLFAFLYRLTDDHALADDLVQETFIRMTAQRGRPPDSVRSWAFTVARNLAYDYFRSAVYKREQATDFDESEDDNAELDWNTPEQAMIETDQQNAVAVQLQSLPPEQREVVILRFYHDLPLGEIAEVTAAPLGTVKSRLFHALKKLKCEMVVRGFAHE